MLQDQHTVKMLFCASEIRVVVIGVKSGLADVLPCILQGTAFGPLLFSLHIYDISSGIESEIRLFVDDCVCYREIKNMGDTLNLRRTLTV